LNPAAAFLASLAKYTAFRAGPQLSFYENKNQENGPDGRLCEGRYVRQAGFAANEFRQSGPASEKLHKEMERTIIVL
jgi:hypothetical protein